MVIVTVDAANGTMLVTSSGDALLLPRSMFSSRGTSSVLHYSPKSEMDFGVVACWASNPAGNQRHPCLFHVVPAGIPYIYTSILYSTLAKFMKKKLLPTEMVLKTEN